MIDEQHIQEIAAKYDVALSRIIRLPEHQPLEVIFELTRTRTISMAIALIEKSRAHYHIYLRETYIVMDGVILLHTRPHGGSAATVKRLELTASSGSFDILPGTDHFAESIGRAAEVMVICTGEGWSPRDHIFLDELSF